MDRISKALEKAKRSSAKRTQRVQAENSVSDSAVAEEPKSKSVAVRSKEAVAASNSGPHGPSERNRKPSHENIVYRETRVERTDPSSLAERRVIAGLKQDPRSSVFQILRTRVLMDLRREGWNSLAITSPTPGCGKTLISANLAVAIAQEVNQTVLLLDMDLRRPKVAEYFGVKPEFGLRDYLIDNVSLSQIFVHPGVVNFKLPGENLEQFPGDLTTRHNR